MSDVRIEKPNIADAGCWVQVRRYSGSLWAQYSACGHKNRKGFLTCTHHKALEGRARRHDKGDAP
jgi:hypothetical protein